MHGFRIFKGFATNGSGRKKAAPYMRRLQRLFFPAKADDADHEAGEHQKDASLLIVYMAYGMYEGENESDHFYCRYFKVSIGK